MQQYEEQSSMVGGVASLSLARGARDGELYVIKRVRCFPCKTKEERMAMAYGVQEARLLMLLQHPNILKAKDFFVEGVHHCTVLEYCLGGDLQQQIDNAVAAQRAIEPVSVFNWIAGTACAVQHFHLAGVIHRDLKPANILLAGRDGRPEDIRVADFGCARQLHHGQETIQTKLAGTKHYMAPEVYNKQTYDTSVDLWSMGVIFLHLLTLKLPSRRSLLRGDLPDIGIEAPSRDLHDAPAVAGAAQDGLSCLRAMLQVDAGCRPSAGHVAKTLRDTVARMARDATRAGGEAGSARDVDGDSQDSGRHVQVVEGHAGDRQRERDEGGEGVGHRQQQQQQQQQKRIGDGPTLDLPHQVAREAGGDASVGDVDVDVRDEDETRAERGKARRERVGEGDGDQTSIERETGAASLAVPHRNACTCCVQ